MGIRNWLTQMQAPLYRRVVAAEHKIHLHDEARHRLRANKLREKAGMQPLGSDTPKQGHITAEDMRGIYTSKQTPAEAVAEYHRSVGE